MNNFSLEITENQYWIKLNKDVFNLSFIQHLIKKIKNEELVFNEENKIYEDDMMSRNLGDYNLNFDNLDEK